MLQRGKIKPRIEGRRQKLKGGLWDDRRRRGRDGRRYWRIESQEKGIVEKRFIASPTKLEKKISPRTCPATPLDRGKGRQINPDLQVGAAEPEETPWASALPAPACPACGRQAQAGQAGLIINL